jgi:hypothetical protein
VIERPIRRRALLLEPWRRIEARRAVKRRASDDEDETKKERRRRPERGGLGRTGGVEFG